MLAARAIWGRDRIGERILQGAGSLSAVACVLLSGSRLKNPCSRPSYVRASQRTPTSRMPSTKRSTVGTGTRASRTEGEGCR